MSSNRRRAFTLYMLSSHVLPSSVDLIFLNSNRSAIFVPKKISDPKLKILRLFVTYGGAIDMPETNPGLSVHVKVTVDPSNTEAFLEALEPTFSNVKAEPLNIFCEIYKDGNDPGVFKFVENWNATMDHMMNVSKVHNSFAFLCDDVSTWCSSCMTRKRRCKCKIRVLNQPATGPNQKGLLCTLSRERGAPVHQASRGRSLQPDAE